MNEELLRLGVAIKKAEDAQTAYLRQKYPLGSRVGVNLMHGQVNPSKGVVIGHFAGVYSCGICVELYDQKPNSRYRVRRIHPDNVAWIEGNNNG